MTDHTTTTTTEGRSFERPVRMPLRITKGSAGYYLHSIGNGEDVLLKQPEPKWFEKLKNAEASAIAIAERTGIAVLVVRVIGRVVPWHQTEKPPNTTDDRPSVRSI